MQGFRRGSNRFGHVTHGILCSQHDEGSAMPRTTRTAARPSSATPAVVFAARDRTAGVGVGAGRRPETARRSEGSGRLTPTVARWPLDVEEAFEGGPCADPAMAIVRQSLADYRSGRADRASRAWDEEIRWCVPGRSPIGGERTGPDAVFDYHLMLGRLSADTYRQRLIALEGSHGSIVNAYLRTTATRDGRHLDIPTLAVFELAGGRVRRVTELPGDLQAWEAFWAD